MRLSPGLIQRQELTTASRIHSRVRHLSNSGVTGRFLLARLGIEFNDRRRDGHNNLVPRPWGDTRFLAELKCRHCVPGSEWIVAHRSKMFE